MTLSQNQQAFFKLLRAGLWKKEAQLSQYNDLDCSAILSIAEEQAVVGLITSGLEHVIDVKVPKEDLLQFIGQSLQIEQQNKDLNAYLARLVELLRNKDVYAILVKGQGIAQCYEKPLWRVSGDIDLLLSNTNYETAKKVLMPLAIDVGDEYKTLKHICMTMQGGFVVELHGTLHSRLSKRVDSIIDEVQRDVLYGDNVRSWNNGGTMVYLPSPDNDVIFVFTHILHHLFIEGVGLRQVCDWCRLLWLYRDSLNGVLLETRLRKMKIMSEWKVFAALAVNWLEMPANVMPLYSEEDKWKRKAGRLLAFILKSGNFGHNIKKKRSHNYIIGKIDAFFYKMRGFARQRRVFPKDSFKFFCHFVSDGIKLSTKSN